MLITEFNVQYDEDTVESIDAKVSKKTTQRKGGILKLRLKVLERDGFRCRYCGIEFGKSNLLVN
jgi:hypothetical protein